jgi:hypothetical protein
MRAANPLAWAATVWTVLAVGCCLRALLFPASHTVYHNYANAGRSWLHGADAYDLARDSSGAPVPRMSGYRYAPLVSVLLVPFALLPDGLGGALWRLVSFACFFGAFAWFQRRVLPGAEELGDRAKAALWLLLVPLSLGSMNNGQANVLLIGLLLSAGAAVIVQRWNLAAAVLAGACLLKIYPLAVALLFVLVYPRQLGWRFLAALGVGLALPLVAQQPAYVLGQYSNWLELLVTDDRRDFALNQGYRDFYLLTRFFGMPMDSTSYWALRALAGTLVAGVCLVGRLRQWPEQHLVQTLLALGCSWMVVFGPSTESSTFIVLAPALSWALVDAFRPGRPHWSRAVLVMVMAMFALTFAATWFPGGRDWFYVLQPLSALVFFVERLLRAAPAPEATAMQQPQLPQAA